VSNDETFSPEQWKDMHEGLDHTRQERFKKLKPEPPLASSVTVGTFFNTPEPKELDTETAAKLREWTENE
jgi:hypothetical protein